MSTVQDIRGKEPVESAVVGKTHAQEQDALIQTITATRMGLQQYEEETLFLRNVCVVLPRFPVSEDAKISGIIQRAETALIKKLAKLKLVEMLMVIFIGGLTKTQLQETRQAFDNDLKLFDELEPILDKAAVDFNKVSTEGKKELYEVFAKKGFPMSPAFLKRCERVAKQAIAA